MALGLGLMYAIGAICFGMLYVGTQGLVYKLVGKYGIIIMLLLAIFQENIDAASGAPVTMGLSFMWLLALFIAFLVIDTLFIIMVIVPQRKQRVPWNQILWGVQQ